MAMCVSNLVYYIMVGVFSSIAYICAFFFDLAVQLSLSSTTYALGFLTTSWEIIRDLGNMAFIFILIYIAIKVILTADDSQTLKTLAIVVVVALLVNFSFFFTRVAIDAGNLLALQFYNAIPGDPIGQSAQGGVSSILSGGGTNATNFAAPAAALASAGNTKDLTQSIMGGLQVQNILNSESFKNYVDPQKNPNSSSMFILISLSTIYIAIGIAFGILAGAFLYAGAKFMMRIVGLWAIIIFSPLALVAATLDKTRGLFDLWLKHLVNFSFYPAAFLFMFFVLSRFMNELNANGNFLSGVFAQPLTNNDPIGFLNILSAIANVGIRLGFVIAMMYLALSAADMLARKRDDFTSPWAKSFAGWVGGGIGGGILGFAGQQTLGRIGRWTGSGALANRTYDPRNMPLFGRALTGFEPSTRKPYSNYGALPIDYGTGAKKGIGLTKKQLDAKAKSDSKKDKREDMLERADIQDEIEERRAARRAQRGEQPPQPTPPAGGNPPGGGQHTAVPAPAAAPAATNPANQPNQTQQGGAPGQAPTMRISQADITGSAAAQRALQNMEKEAAARNAQAARNLYLQNQGENFMQGKTSAEYEDRITTLQRQGEDIKQLVREQSAQLHKTAAQAAVIASLSKEPDMPRSSMPRAEAQRAAAPAHGEMSDETMQKMKKMMRAVIRKETPAIVQSAVDSRQSELPKTPTGAAMRPPAPPANDDHGDIQEAA